MRGLLSYTLALALVTFTTTEPVAAKATKGKTAKPAAAAVAAMMLKLDTAASTIKWIGAKKLVPSSHDGTVKLKSGQIEFENNQIAGGAFEIDMTTIADESLKDSPKNQAKLVGHLRSPDFFDTAKFPTATFKINSAKALPTAKAGDPTHEITGDLTIKGKTNPITIPAKITMKDGIAQATAKMSIDRTLWDIRFNSGKFFTDLGDKIIKDEIEFVLDLVAKK